MMKISDVEENMERGVNKKEKRWGEHDHSVCSYMMYENVIMKPLIYIINIC